MSLWSPGARDAYRKSHPGSFGTSNRIETLPKKLEKPAGEARQPQPTRTTGIWGPQARDAYVAAQRQEQLKEKIAKFAEQVREGLPPLSTDCFDTAPTGRNPRAHQR
ncbi:hypothetical protein ATI61_1251 [Archangium gephyra]|uniref:Uncharacterized protein n=1 Tax=Archangium gephyra TaxID=48 RepID=A0AAC8QJ30_9BACT|nr:hypothetical protein [Archangium gephyra]AKJ08339.1 Hypothetical protein AA314_09965 [Archangium gephyra]REG15375.1 hypothetical protein ATI61_1251 [Archangium gephyra]